MDNTRRKRLIDAISTSSDFDEWYFATKVRGNKLTPEEAKDFETRAGDAILKELDEQPQQYAAYFLTGNYDVISLGVFFKKDMTVKAFKDKLLDRFCSYLDSPIEEVKEQIEEPFEILICDPETPIVLSSFVDANSKRDEAYLHNFKSYDEFLKWLYE